MFFTLGLKNLPFKQDARQIIYVESQYDKEINTLIQIHFLDIYYRFDFRGYEFCYLPWKTRQIEDGEGGRYFTPYRDKDDRIAIKSDFMLNYMVHPEDRNNIQPSLLYYDPNCISEDDDEADCQFSGIVISKDSFEESSDLSTVLDDIINDIIGHRESAIRFHKTSDIESEDENEDEIRFSLADKDEIGAWTREPSPVLRLDEDEIFDTESKELMEEILERVEMLKRRGINSYIIQQMINSKDDKLSRLLITKDYRIILKDYGDMEINMTPLPKALFLLYLRYPEGIMFSYLPDYREELLAIYKKLKGRFSNDVELRKSVWDVTDPLGNSIHEKSSRIRAAFVSQFDERLARYYYVDGKRGELKKIALPRELVTYEQ